MITKEDFKRIREGAFKTASLYEVKPGDIVRVKIEDEPEYWIFVFDRVDEDDVYNRGKEGYMYDDDHDSWFNDCSEEVPFCYASELEVFEVYLDNNLSFGY